jgi:hypothetical protein
VVAWADQVNGSLPGSLRHPGDPTPTSTTTTPATNWDDKAATQNYNPHWYGTGGGSINDGEQLWQKLVRRHAFVMTLNGHVLGDGTGYLASVTDKGNTCHQMLSNYQCRSLGRGGLPAAAGFPWRRPDREGLHLLAAVRTSSCTEPGPEPPPSRSMCR